MSVEVAQDDGVILDMEESGEGGGVARGAGGVRWDVDVVDVDGNGINGGSNGKVLYFGVVGKEVICGKWGIGDGVVDKYE